MTYRPDIDGLRMIAVTSVVLYHINSSWVPGGFAGVDVFFVISGYLITSLLQRDIAAGRFSLVGFYERRIRRIFPALIAVMAATFVAGLIIFMPDELRDLGVYIAATAAFCTNILAWLDTDYFAGAVDFKPLLHTWSLAVEEQFYVVIPILLYALHRWTPRATKAVIVALAVISFALSCAWVLIDPSGNYYLPHTRAWELLLGSIIALGVIPKPKASLVEATAALGAVLLIAPMFYLNSKSVFPAWNALPTCVGTAMIILAGQQSMTAVGRTLALKPVVAIGLISYSLYLIHWPVLAFLKYQLLREPNAMECAGALLAMLVLAWLSWRFVERPFRKPGFLTGRKVLAVGTGAAIAIAGLGVAAFGLNGLPQRFGAEAKIALRDTKQQRADPRCFMRGSYEKWGGEACFITTASSGSVTLLWGDSHANHYVPAIRANPSNFPGNILQYSSAGCQPVLGMVAEGRPNCKANNDNVLKIIDQYKVRRVVMSAYWQRGSEGYGYSVADIAATVKTLRAKGIDVRVIGDNPDFPFSNPAYLAVRLARRDDPDTPFYSRVRNSPSFNKAMAAALGGAGFYDPMAVLCRGAECEIYEGGELLVIDNSHLSEAGANKVLAALKPFDG